MSHNNHSRSNRSDNRNNRGSNNRNTNRNYNKNRRDQRNSSNKDKAIIIKKSVDKERVIKDAIFAFSGGQKSLTIKGEGNEISTAVEVAEIIKNRMYPGIQVGNISLGSRPFFQKRNSRERENRKKNDIVSQIEILLKTT